MIDIDIEALERKFAAYPHILKFIELQMYFENGDILNKLANLSKKGLQNGCMGGDCKSFDDLDRLCEVILIRAAEIAQTNSD